MRVLDQGVYETWIPPEMKCHTCTARFQADYNDLFTYKDEDWRGDPTTSIGVKCPVCEAMVMVKAPYTIVCHLDIYKKVQSEKKLAKELEERTSYTIEDARKHSGMY